MNVKNKTEKIKKHGKIIGEFKEFISRGNVVDMAVGIIIGSAFTAIVTSLVNDVIMPAVGYLIGGRGFADYKWVLTPAVGDVAETAVCYGAFIQKIIDFLLIALVVFAMVKLINVLRRKKEEKPAEPPKPSSETLLLTEIRDLLKEQQSKK